jgi:hypothetical protein
MLSRGSAFAVSKLPKIQDAVYNLEFDVFKELRTYM